MQNCTTPRGHSRCMQRLSGRQKTRGTTSRVCEFAKGYGIGLRLCVMMNTVPFSPLPSHTFCSDSPDMPLTISGADILRKATSSSPAMAFANRVLPQPGGPCSRMPRGCNSKIHGAHQHPYAVTQQTTRRQRNRTTKIQETESVLHPVRLTRNQIISREE